jgi:rhodanese-related sulfurtransferase
MENVDDYLFRDDVQYVDLRNFDSRYNSGYIEGFESIPFFDYLDYRLFDREDLFEFHPDHLLNEREVERLFDKDKAIFLYADGCIRSGYIAQMLFHLGYERVFVLGGFYEYVGEHLVLGTGDYIFGNTFYANYTSSTSGITYLMYGTYNMGRKILTIRFDMIDGEGKTMRGHNYDPEINYDEQLTILENFIVSDLVTFNELEDHLEDTEQFGYDQIEGFHLGFDPDFITLIKTLVINP